MKKLSVRKGALVATANSKIITVMVQEPRLEEDDVFVRTLTDFAHQMQAKHPGKTLLLVMHDVGAALELADRVAVLENGSLSFYGTPHEALAEEIPEKHFGLARYAAKRGETQGSVWSALSSVSAVTISNATPRFSKISFLRGDLDARI